MGRAPCCEKVGLKKGRWTAEEDKILTDYIQENGEGSWRSLPKNAGLLRCGKSCRLRWINYLRADVKRGNITPEEEELIVKLHAVLGNRWSVIAGQLEGRTDNEIKNYWNSHLRRKIYCFMRCLNNESLPPIDLANMASTSKRRGKGTKNQVEVAMEEDHNMALNKNSHEPMPQRNATSQVCFNGGEPDKEISMMDICYEMDQGNGYYNNNNNNNTVASLYPNMNGDVEGLGPYQWLDDEIRKLSHMFENGVLVNNLSVNGNVTLKDEPNGNDSYGHMQMDTMGTSEDKKSASVWNSSNEDNGGWYNTSCLSVNSVSDYQWPNWDFTSSTQSHNQWDLCEQDQNQSCLWGIGIGEVDGFHH
ncbi:hypothetical protein TanjilG_26527 [Lupinus angustifolius]|uniref:Uncharacterized protein n=1 Tax=Lupinus angustifolius TaxID=3871 RepID=A0A4P1QPJ7_LUPAN|nr:PREDICTED: transcription repressor MYB6-like [Lupinus angustifolius]XP_019426003.1 PREDICTED: transcription repressor MYB6-like [Lupinus angustifolius]OIV91674.1 hypothetical protein TanjilG_26527 [Lupinus angustifolius]